MRIFVVYDSVYGNTEKIAKAISASLAGEVRVVAMSEADPTVLSASDLLIVGSPTHGGRPTPATQGFLDGIPELAAKGMKAAAFDTRLPGRFAAIFGYAADRIAESLKGKGCEIGLPPEAFYVKGKKGPLREGELERASGWAKRIV